MIQRTAYQVWGKRTLDLVISSSALLILSVPMFAIGTMVRIRLGSPVLFRQERPGRHGQPFTLIKFRSMSTQTDDEGHLLPDDLRVTRLGRFLRSSSLDELPELWNVLRGDMSLVGPRPLLMEYLPLYTAEQVRRHEVRPGLTGLAQVKGRNGLSWQEKFTFDVEYVDNLSFGLDVRILLGTFSKVLARDGITPNTSASVPKYGGPPPDSR